MCGLRIHLYKVQNHGLLIIWPDFLLSPNWRRYLLLLDPVELFTISYLWKEDIEEKGILYLEWHVLFLEWYNLFEDFGLALPECIYGQWFLAQIFSNSKILLIPSHLRINQNALFLNASNYGIFPFVTPPLYILYLDLLITSSKYIEV